MSPITIHCSCSVCCWQIPLLPECVHCELLVCVVGLGEMGARDRLDGHACHQPSPGLQRAGGHLAKGGCVAEGWGVADGVGCGRGGGVWQGEVWQMGCVGGGKGDVAEGGCMAERGCVWVVVEGVWQRVGV